MAWTGAKLAHRFAVKIVELRYAAGDRNLIHQVQLMGERKGQPAALPSTPAAGAVESTTRSPGPARTCIWPARPAFRRRRLRPLPLRSLRISETLSEGGDRLLGRR